MYTCICKEYLIVNPSLGLDLIDPQSSLVLTIRIVWIIRDNTDFRIALSLDIDAEAECHKDQVRDIKITGFQIPMLYDAIEPSFEGMDDAFETVVQGVVVVVLEAQNILAVTALKNIVSTYLDNIFC